LIFRIFLCHDVKKIIIEQIVSFLGQKIRAIKDYI
jgi:hypothetical protein